MNEPHYPPEPGDEVEDSSGTTEVKNPMRHYYVNTDDKIVKHFEELVSPPDGFEYAGKSELTVLAAAGFYTKGASGFKVVEGESKADPPPE